MDSSHSAHLRFVLGLGRLDPPAPGRASPSTFCALHDLLATKIGAETRGEGNRVGRPGVG
jgi:hypothetical protein